jgi:excisionase family DNA binding protein
MQKKYITSREVAELLKISIATVKNWTKENKIPYYKVNKRVLFEENELNDWISSQKQEVVSK